MSINLVSFSFIYFLGQNMADHLDERDDEYRDVGMHDVKLDNDFMYILRLTARTLERERISARQYSIPQLKWRADTLTLCLAHIDDSPVGQGTRSRAFIVKRIKRNLAWTKSIIVKAERGLRTPYVSMGEEDQDPARAAELRLEQARRERVQSLRQSIRERRINPY